MHYKGVAPFQGLIQETFDHPGRRYGLSADRFALGCLP